MASVIMGEVLEITQKEFCEDGATTLSEFMTHKLNRKVVVDHFDYSFVTCCYHIYACHIELNNKKTDCGGIKNGGKNDF